MESLNFLGNKDGETIFILYIQLQRLYKGTYLNIVIRNYDNVTTMLGIYNYITDSTEPVYVQRYSDCDKTYQIQQLLHSPL